jgi:hypothetical protein
MSAGSFKGIRFSISKEVSYQSLDPILWASILEDRYVLVVLGTWIWFLESMKNSNLINSVLSSSCPSILTIFFILGTKGKGVRGEILAQRRRKKVEYLETSHYSNWFGSTVRVI